jgi:hypothetical protein
MPDQPLIAAVHVRVDARAAAGGLNTGGLLKGNHGPLGPRDRNVVRASGGHLLISIGGGVSVTPLEKGVT